MQLISPYHWSSVIQPPFNHFCGQSLGRPNCFSILCVRDPLLKRHGSPISPDIAHSWFSSSLHACVRFNPPPNIVRLLLEFFPESLSHVDCLHRTPLHVAVGTRADLDVIQLLADAYPAARSVQDEDGKTPLHLACNHTCRLFLGNSPDTPWPTMYQSSLDVTLCMSLVVAVRK